MAKPEEHQPDPAATDPHDQAAEPTEIPLNAALAEQMGQDATHDYARFLVELAALAAQLDPDDAVGRLEHKQDELGIRQAAAVNDKLVEQLRATGTNVVVTIDQRPVLSVPGVDYTPRRSDPTQHSS